jgi:hypothetical protein
VVLLPGSYTNNGLIGQGAPNLNIHGEFGQPRPVINEPGIGQIQISSGTFSYVDIESGANNAFNLSGGTMERVFMRGAGNGNVVCQCYGGVLRDSVIVSTGPTAPLGVVSNGGTAVGTYRNVTAIATDPSASAILIDQGGTPNPLTFDGYNVIAHSPSSADVAAYGNGASITLHHSNYRTSQELNSGVVKDAPGDPHQAATPLFTNAAGFEFSEAPGSPTIDAGLSDPLNGPVDFSGDTRTLGMGTDIGAYEYTPAAAPGPSPTSPPAPAKRKCKKKHKKRAAAAKKCRKKKRHSS